MISEAALKSDWVKQEITWAEELNENYGTVQKVLPVIIDNRIRHDNEEIPDWLKESVQPEEKWDINSVESVSVDSDITTTQDQTPQEKPNKSSSKSWDKKIVQNDEEIPDWLK